MPGYGEACRDVAFARMTWLEGGMADRTFIAGDAFSVAHISAFCAIWPHLCGSSPSSMTRVRKNELRRQ